jgi:hypothetical protein
MFYGMLGLLYAFRRFTQTWNWRWLVVWAVGFGLMYGLVRMRTYILGMAVMAGFTLFRQASPKARFGLIALIPFALLALFQTPMMASIFSTDKAYAFDVRYISTMKAIAFLGTDPMRWIFGAGTLSPVDPSAMMTYFNHFFFLADITWVGMIFEFGWWGRSSSWRCRCADLDDAASARARGPLNGALQDYLLYCVLVSEMFPLTMAPGEVTMIMAIAVWRLEKVWRAKPCGAARCEAGSRSVNALLPKRRSDAPDARRFPPVTTTMASPLLARLKRQYGPQALTLGVRLIDLPLRYGMHVLIALEMSLDQMGAFYVVFGTMLAISGLGRIGIDRALTREMARMVAQGDVDGARLAFFRGLWLTTALTIVTTVGFAAAAWPVSVHVMHKPAMALPFLYGALAIVPQNYANLFAGALSGLQRITQSQIIYTWAWPAGFCAAALLFHLDAAGAMLAVAAAMGMAFVAAGVMLWRAFPSAVGARNPIRA